MGTLDTLVSINIKNSTAPIPVASFSIPLIIGPTVPTSGGPVVAYTSAAGMLQNGYTTSSPEYIRALALMSQAQSPSEFFVGQRLAAVEQANSIQVASVTSGHVYQLTINSTLISYTAQSSDTQLEILEGLFAAITAASLPLTGNVGGSGSGSILTLSSSIAGQGVSYTLVDANLTLATITANHGIADDLAAIIAENNQWYGVMLCSNVQADILQLAAAIEPLEKIFIASTNESGIGTSVTTDTLSLLKGHDYDRTALVFSPGSWDQGIDAAWVGGQLPSTPGSNAWAYKQLQGITADVISDGARSIIIGDPVAQVSGKNGNIYTTVGGYDITQMGQMVSGQYIDITIGLDWLKSTLQSNVMAALIGAAKIPYTDRGTGVLISAVKAAIDQGVADGLIDGNSAITISAPAVLSVPQAQRANRVAPTISFSCRLQGAFSAVVVNGTVTV